MISNYLASFVQLIYMLVLLRFFNIFRSIKSFCFLLNHFINKGIKLPGNVLFIINCLEFLHLFINIMQLDVLFICLMDESIWIVLRHRLYKAVPQLLHLVLGIPSGLLLDFTP
jgi:hypothetical protein